MQITTLLIKKIIIAIISIYITVLLTVFSGMTSTGITILDTIMYNSIPVFLGLVIFPKCTEILRIIELKKKIDLKINMWSLISIIAMVIIALIKSHLGIEVIMATLIIAISEEYLFRYFLMDGNDSKIIIVVSSILFTFVVHGNESLLSNLIIRFPLGLVLASVYFRSNNYYLPTALHFLYNLLMI